MIDQKLRKTFVLAYPSYFIYGGIGDFVTKLEKLGLKITEMRCMNVSEDFARKHLVNIERVSDENLAPDKWVRNISCSPVVAMIVEGDNNSVNEVIELTSKQQLSSTDIGTSYASGSCEQAERDIDFWFSEDNFDVRTSKRSFHASRRENIRPTEASCKEFKAKSVLQVQKVSDCFRVPSMDLKTVFYMEDMCVFLIKPLAFQERCVGEILNAIESSCSGLRGGVDQSSNCLTDSGSLSKTDDDEYYVAVVAQGIEPCFEILPGVVKNIDYDNKLFQISSDYLHRSEPGQEVLEAAKEFFKYGFSFWAIPDHCLLSGCMFEASFVGLKSLK
ncbi:hypothetical protein MKW92_019287 [Papaver armeniacum]|nr:hypothetical protein MKW92_019287 [Papaver armeniacum]